MSAPLQRAFLLFEVARYDLARKSVLEHLKEDPDDATGVALLARCGWILGDGDPAIELAQRAVGLDAVNAYAIDSLARVLFDAKRYDECRRAIRAGLRVDPVNAHFMGLWAWVECHEHDYAVAIDIAVRGLKSDPAHVGCMSAKASAEYSSGDWSASRITCESILRIDPQNEFAHRVLGWIAVLARRPDEARERFDQALRLNPHNEYSRLGLVAAIRARSRLFNVLYGWSQTRDFSTGRISVFFAAVVGSLVLAGSLFESGRTPTVLAMGCIAAFLLLVFVGTRARELVLLRVWCDARGRRVLSPGERATVHAMLVGIAVLGAGEIGSLLWIRPPGVASLAGLVFAFPVFAAFAAARIESDEKRAQHWPLVGFDALLALATYVVVLASNDVDARIICALLAATLAIRVFVGIHAWFVRS